MILQFACPADSRAVLAAQQDRGASDRQGRLLVADDNVDAADLLSEVLRMEG